MTRRNPPSRETPEVVTAAASAVQARIGRAAYIRQVKNGDEWFISDPVFSFVQHGFRKGATGYRVGFFYSSSRDELAFYMVHAPTMAKLFKKNFSIETVLAAASATAQFRSRSHMFWSSCFARERGSAVSAIEETDLDDFRREAVEFDNEFKFKRDLFPQSENQGKGTGTAKWAGNDFGLLLGERLTAFPLERVHLLIEGAWPLFLLLYPTEALEQRVASLARNLLTARAHRACEFHRIAGASELQGASASCSGLIEGAHIKPHAYGGTDLSSNGLWLCQYHHRLTEGRLNGDRTCPRFAYAADAQPVIATN